MNRKEFYSLLDNWENIHLLINYLIEYPNQLDALIAIGLSNDQKENWRAIWIADKIHEKHPELIRPYLGQLTEALKTTSCDSKLRHLLKLISLNPIDQQYLSFLLAYCLELVDNATSPIANRVHGMQILFEISEQEPELKPELIQLFEHELEKHESPAIRSRGKRLLKKLYSST